MGPESMPRHQLHWLHLGRGGVSEVEAPREGQQEDQCWELRQRAQQEKANSTEEKRRAVGHDLAPPNCFSKDLFLSSTPHPQDVAVTLAGSGGADSTQVLPQSCCNSALWGRIHLLVRMI